MKVKWFVSMVVIIGLLLSLNTVAAQVAFEMMDPEGDDVGPGTYVYPKASPFVAGIFDLLHFKVETEGDKVVFYFQFKALGPADNPNPWGSQTGFCLQIMQVYIDTDRKSGSGRTDTFMANLDIDKANAWEIGLAIGPHWGNPDDFIKNNRVTKGEVDELGNIEVSADVATNRLIAKVPVDVIGTPTNKWAYSVLVGGWDGMGPTGFRAVGVEAEDWVAGGADSMAVAAGVNPIPFDVLVPEGKDQLTILKTYTIDPPKFAVLYAIGPGIPAKFPTNTVLIIVVAVVVILLIVFTLKKKKAA